MTCHRRYEGCVCDDFVHRVFHRGGSCFSVCPPSPRRAKWRLRHWALPFRQLQVLAECRRFAACEPTPLRSPLESPSFLREVGLEAQFQNVVANAGAVGERPSELQLQHRQVHLFVHGCVHRVCRAGASSRRQVVGLLLCAHLAHAHLRAAQGLQPLRSCHSCCLLVSLLG